MGYIENLGVLGLRYEEYELSEDMYGIKCPYPMNPDYITIHNTANDADASAEVGYMQRNGYETSYHFAVDNEVAIQGLPLDRNGWHAGDGNGEGNRNSIGIEICHSTCNDDEFWYENEHNGSKLAAALLYDYGWGTDRLRKHQDWSGKYCPHRILDMDRWETFIENTQEYLDELDNYYNGEQEQEDDVNAYYDYGKNPFYDSREDFIEKVANAALSICENYGRTPQITPVVVAQAILESGAGTTGKAALYNNYFGMKDRGDRVTCCDGTFESRSQEQNEDGSYEDIVCEWYSFPGLDQGVEGYYQFTNISNYDNLKGVTDCEEYINNLKADGYATSQSYVDNILRIIDENDLMRFAPPLPEPEIKNGWVEENGNKYWYDDGVMACNKEVYDPETDAWYWFDSDGTMATEKDVYIPGQDKWVRYDYQGHMVKGWSGTYYFDTTTGAMAKGFTDINGQTFYFDKITGVMVVNKEIEGHWADADGTIAKLKSFFNADRGIWMFAEEDGTFAYSKEVYDPNEDAWKWCDADGSIATNKDVYIPNSNKWVRYDSNGRMVKGWYTDERGTYYFDLNTGAMAKGEVYIDGERYYFDETTGIRR